MHVRGSSHDHGFARLHGPSLHVAPRSTAISKLGGKSNRSDEVICRFHMQAPQIAACHFRGGSPVRCRSYTSSDVRVHPMCVWGLFPFGGDDDPAANEESPQ